MSWIGMVVIIEYRSWPSSVYNFSLTLICFSLSEAACDTLREINAEETKAWMQRLEFTVKLKAGTLFQRTAETVWKTDVTAITKQVMKWLALFSSLVFGKLAFWITRHCVMLECSCLSWWSMNNFKRQFDKKKMIQFPITHIAVKLLQNCF